MPLKAGPSPTRYADRVANPFIELTRDDLSRELSAAAVRLQQRGGSTPEQRAAFADELRLMLIAAANRLADQRLMPGTPAHELSRVEAADPVAVYAQWLEREAVSARSWALAEVGEPILGPVRLQH